MFVIFYRIADTTTATRTGGTVSPMPVIENSNHEEEIIPVFVLFVLYSLFLFLSTCPLCSYVFFGGESLDENQEEEVIRFENIYQDHLYQRQMQRREKA